VPLRRGDDFERLRSHRGTPVRPLFHFSAAASSVARHCLLGMFVLMRTDYRKLREPAVVYPVVCIILLLLVGTLFLDKSHATHRWIKFGPVGVQPSELAKLAVILYLAWFLDLRRRGKGGMEFCKEDFLQTILPASGPVLICVVLILLQPDLGTSVEIVLFTTAIFYVAGLSWKWIAAGAVTAIRFSTFDLTSVVPPGAAHGISRSCLGSAGRRISIAAVAHCRGFWRIYRGRVNESKQKLFYLPEAHTDFIYAVISEELGFIGAAIVIALFVVYGWRGMRAAFAAPDGFGRLLALGITAMVLSQALINFASCSAWFRRKEFRSHSSATADRVCSSCCWQPGCS